MFEVDTWHQTQYNVLALLYRTLIFHPLRACYYYSNAADGVMHCQRSQQLAPGHITLVANKGSDVYKNTMYI